MPILSSVAFATAKAYGFGSPDLFAGAALSLAFDETTTLDSRITFTRATDGTYFDSAGTLQTASSGVARFDHRLEGGVWVNKGLLIEEQRTNLQKYSEDFSQASQLTNVTVTTNTNDTTAPDGTNTADIIVENTTNGLHFLITPITSVTASTKYTFSVFAKKGTRDFVRVGFSVAANWPTGQGLVYFNLANGTIGTNGSPSDAVPSIQDVGNGWYRCSVSLSSLAGASSAFGGAVFVADQDNQPSYAGLTGGKAAYVWGAQLEVGAFPTSYIKTTTASVTRNADVASMTGTNFSSWYNATESTIFAQSTIYYDLPSGTFPRIFEIGDGTTGERIIQNYASDLPGVRMIVTDGGTNVVALSFSIGQSNGITRKIAGAYKVNDFAGSINGGTVLTDTSGTMPTVNKINFGSSQDNNSNLINGHIAKFYYWNTRKPDLFLESITG